jgi:putative membrane protein
VVDDASASSPSSAAGSLESVEPDGQQADATRRTRLANERTYLAWWRSGLTAFAVGVGYGKLVPGLTDVTRWPYEVAGVCFALLGTVFILYGARRQQQVDRALTRGEFSRPDDRVLLGLTIAGLALGLFSIVLVFVTD